MSKIAPAHVLLSIEEIVRANLGLESNTLLIGEIVAICKELPDNANAVQPSYAEFLAGRFLKGLDLCNELYALSIGYELKMEIYKKKIHGEAFIVRSKTKGLKTAKEMEAYANTDDLYVAAAEKFAEAKMLRVLVENIRSNFERAHYLMRKIADKDVENDAGNTLPTSSSEDEDSDGWSSFATEQQPAKQIKW